MGFQSFQSTEVAKESSDVIWDDNFASVVKVSPHFLFGRIELFLLNDACLTST